MTSKEQRCIEKKCYMYCKKCHWKLRKSTVMLINGCTYSSKEIYQYALHYIRLNVSSIYDYDEISLCWDDDLRTFYKTYRNIVDLSSICHSQIVDFDWVRKNFKPHVREFVYDVFMAFHWDAKEIEGFCEEHSISVELMDQLVRQHWDFKKMYWNDTERKSFRDHYHYYCQNKTVNMEKVMADMEQLRKKRENSDAYYVQLLEQLLKLSNLDDIIELIGSYERLDYLRTSLGDYLSVYWKGNSAVETNIKDKLQLFSDYLKQQKMENAEKRKAIKCASMLNMAKSVVGQYLEGNYFSISEFCDVVQIEKATFQKYVSILKETEDVLYDQYLEYYKAKQARDYAVLLGLCKSVLTRMEAGVTENGMTRKFDLIDYYQHASMSFSHFKDIIKDKVSQKQYVCFCKFSERFRKDKVLNVKDLRDILSTKVMTDVQFDQSGRVIDGTGREVTEKEKKMLFAIVQSMDVPLTYGTYEAALQRWKTGFIDFDQLCHQKDGKVKKL